MVLTTYSSGTFRSAFALPLLLFLPGYSLILLLFPKPSTLHWFERIVLAIGASIALATLIGLLLNYSPWSIDIPSLMISLLGVVLLFSLATLYQSNKSHIKVVDDPVEEVPSPAFHLTDFAAPRWKLGFAVILILLNIGAVSALIFNVTKEVPSEPFTGFYILTDTRFGGGYPTELAANTEAEITLGIENLERAVMVYSVNVMIDREIIGHEGPVTLEVGESWVNPVRFMPTTLGSDKQLKFLLSKGENTEPEQNLFLIVDIK